MSAINSKYLIQLDSKAIGYTPFSFLNIILFIGIVIFFSHLYERPFLGSVESYYWPILIFITILEIIALQFVFPNENIELDLNNKEWTFQYVLDNQILKSRKITAYYYWWNYNFGSNLKSQDDPNYSTGNSSLDGQGIANGITLYLLLIDEKGESILLYEEEGNWASIPHWDYHLKSKVDYDTTYKCFHLKKVIKKMNGKKEQKFQKITLHSF